MLRDAAAWKGFTGAYRFFPAGPYEVASSPVVYEALSWAFGSGGGFFFGAGCGPALGLWRAESHMLSVAGPRFRAATWSFFIVRGDVSGRPRVFPTLSCLLAFSGERTTSGQDW